MIKIECPACQQMIQGPDEIAFEPSITCPTCNVPFAPKVERVAPGQRIPSVPMASCPACNRSVSIEASKCPQCGQPLRRWQRGLYAVKLTVMLVVVGLLLWGLLSEAVSVYHTHCDMSGNFVH